MHTAKNELLKIRSYLLTSVNAAYTLLFLEEFSSISLNDDILELYYMYTLVPSLLLNLVE